jgi:hypothetical protein
MAPHSAQGAGAVTLERNDMRHNPQVQTECPQCGKIFKVENYRLKNDHRPCCGLKCRNHAHRKEPAVRFWKHVDKSGACWLWKGAKCSSGYGTFSIPATPKKITISAHRWSWEFHFGNVPDGLCVLHNCPGGDNPSCVRPEHLWLGTHDDNNKDRARKNRSALGERAGTAKLTNEQVIIIRQLAAAGQMSLRAIGRQFGVVHHTIKAIASRKHWTHV